MPAHMTDFIRKHNFEQATLLVVEDNEDTWTIIRHLLATYAGELKPIWFAEAGQALAYLDACLANDTPLPKLMLQDLYVPHRQDGLGLLEAIRGRLADCTCQQIPIIVMSSSLDTDDIREVYRCGGSCFFVKPTDYQAWAVYFQHIRQFWLESVVLPLA